MSKDISQSKHGGNAESAAAFEAVKDSLNKCSRAVLAALRELGEANAKEVAEKLGKPLNAISGRFSELKRDGVIETTGLIRNRSRVCKLTAATQSNQISNTGNTAA